MTKNKKYGFSLIEAMLSLVILSVVLVMTASLVTKKIDFKNHEGVIYTYQSSNSNKNCYVLNKDADAYEETKDCTEYVFEVPQGVSKVNLTLVAGGGGGAGGYLPRTLKGGGRLPAPLYKLEQGGSAIKATVLPEYLAGLRELKIDYLTAMGEETASGTIVADCKNSSTKLCTDSGKKSSAAIMNYSADNQILNQIGRVDKLTRSQLNGKDKALGEFNVDFSNGAILSAGFNYSGTTSADILKCTIPKAADTNLPSCLLNTEAINLIPGYNAFMGKAGQPVYDYNLSKVTKGSVLQGGIGGQIPYMINNSMGIAYGSGANGKQKTLKCQTASITQCDTSTAGVDIGNSEKSAGKGYAQMSYDADLISDVIPSGGAGGAVLRTLDFPVTPGEKYIIRVGKGGTGGRGSASEGAGVKNDITGWENAKGGATTSIYKLDGTTETLVYMVNGGMQGRMANQPSYTVPGVFSSSEAYLNLIKPDKDIISSLEATTNVKDEPISGYISRKIQYTFLTKQPYIRLNSPEHGVSYSSGAVMRAFSAFPKIFTGTGNAVQEKEDNKLEGSSVTVGGTTIEKVYDGLFPRRIINGRYAYIGGLGGFSGLGTKAGCGGYFGGNADARTTDDTLIGLTDTAKAGIVINKFIADGKLYKVNDYYEGCSTETPNGGTPKFVMPDFKKHLFGSAGAGGGAGGYHIEAGTGNGGSGQNGYLMIEWRK